MREIGRGNGGSVELVLHKSTQREMARKIIVLEVNEDIRRQIVRELKVLGISFRYIINSNNYDFRTM